MKGVLYLEYGVKEKTNTDRKFLNNYINKKEKQGDKAKNQLYKFVAYNIKWKSERGVCVKPELMDGHVCYKLRNSLGGYGGVRVVRISDDLGGSSSRERGGVVVKSAAVHSRWCVKKSVRVQMGSYGRSVFFPSTLVVSLALQIFAA